MQRTIRGRIEVLEQGQHTGVRPAYKMLIGETEGQARARLGLSENIDALFVQRVIVRPRAQH
jgi:hypothetical protein